LKYSITYDWKSLQQRTSNCNNFDIGGKHHLRMADENRCLYELKCDIKLAIDLVEGLEELHVEDVVHGDGNISSHDQPHRAAWRERRARPGGSQRRPDNEQSARRAPRPRKRSCVIFGFSANIVIEQA
jgi:hypothetical protein